MELQEIRSAIRGKQAEARRLCDQVVPTKTDAEIRRIEAQHGALLDDIDDLQARADAYIDAALTGDRRAPRGADGSASAVAATDSHSQAFLRYLTRPQDVSAERQLQDFQERSGNSLTGAAGGYIVPEIINDQIMMRERDANPLRDAVRVLNVTSGDIKLPLSNGDASQGWVGETGTRSGTTEPTLSSRAPTFGGNYSYVEMSRELAMDSIIDVENWFVAEVGRALGEAEADAIVSGNGTAKPTGMLDTAPEAGADGSRTDLAFKYIASTTSASMGSDTAEVQSNLTELVYDLKAGYRANGSWLMNSATAGTIRKLQDADNRQIWSDSLMAGTPNMLLGFPVIICESMPDIGTNAHPVAFGDFERGYTLCLHGGVYIQNADRNITTPGMHKIFVEQRVGGITYDENAVRWLKCAAS